MSYNREDYVRIKSEFSQKYLKARERAEERREELYARIPEVFQLDQLLSRTGVEIMAAISNGANAVESIAELQRRNGEILAKRGALLRAAGYPENYSDIHYECEHCGDTGYVETTMCDCMKRALVMAGYESSGLGNLIRTQSFDNFSTDYYKVPGGNYEAVCSAVNSLRSFAEGFESATYRNYLLMGGTGLGKTHLSTAVAKTVIDRGFDVLYVTATGMIADFEAKRFGNGGESRRDTSRYFDAELLILDDLGTENVNQFTLSCVYDVVNERINHRRSTMINTNCSFRDLEAKYNERITSRLFGEYRLLMIQGKDIRMQKVTRQ